MSNWFTRLFTSHSQSEAYRLGKQIDDDDQRLAAARRRAEDAKTEESINPPRFVAGEITMKRRDETDTEFVRRMAKHYGVEHVLRNEETQKPPRRNFLVEMYDENPQQFHFDLMDLLERRGVKMYGFDLAPRKMRQLRWRIRRMGISHPERLQE